MLTAKPNANLPKNKINYEEKINYRLKKNYIKYLISNDIKYIGKIRDIVKVLNFNGGSVNMPNSLNEKDEKDEKDIKYSTQLVLNNIDLIIQNINYFNSILNLVHEHDQKMSLLNKDFVKFNPETQSLIEYLDLIYLNEIKFI